MFMSRLCRYNQG